MIVKTSAYYQREYRRRLRDQGLIKKEIWIRPEHADRARAMEKQLRDGRRIDSQSSGPGDAKRPRWRTEALFDDLTNTALIREGRASAELIEGIDPTLHVVMHEYGDLPIFVTAAGNQIIAESVLWPVSEVRNAAEFNEMVLRTHKYFPLSTICLGQRARDDYYLMFGSLSAASDLPDIVYEIEILGNNVIHATEAYAELLKPPGDIKGETL